MARHWIIGIVAFMLTATSVSHGDAVEAELLQFRLDRLYFNVGVEANLFDGAQFDICCGDSVVYSGRIERALPGVSFSFPTGHYFDSLPLTDCEVQIIAADVDSLSPIVIGGAEFEEYQGGGFFPPRLVHTAENKNSDSKADRVSIATYDSRLEMILEFEASRLDGFFSYRMPEFGEQGFRTVSAAAPYIVCLLPNPSKKISREGYLTTSMYYRFDESKLQFLVDADSVQWRRRFVSPSRDAHRAYQYDPSRGRSLLNAFRRRPKRISLAFNSPILRKTARYYADVLSRDRIRVEFVSNMNDADVWLTLIPVSADDPVLPLRFIFDLLTNDKPAGATLAQQLFEIEERLVIADSASDSALLSMMVESVERILMEELSAFPLYRPTIFFVCTDAIRGGRFDSEGYLDLKSLVRLRFPSSGGDTAQ
ncbi:MAG: hypothetical protein ACE5FH_04820 [Candidatus Zixiibacteriota bacterium]